jgi:hypothetical protein
MANMDALQWWFFFVPVEPAMITTLLTPTHEDVEGFSKALQ